MTYELVERRRETMQHDKLHIVIASKNRMRSW